MKFSLLLPLIFAASLAHAETSPALLGNWARSDGGVRMTVSACGTAFCAVNTWVKNPQGAEKVGDKLVMKLTSQSVAVWSGQAYDVRRGRSYKMTITLQGKSMVTRGCVLLGVVCKDADWTRAGS